MISPSLVIQRTFQLWGTPVIDLLASALNNKLLLYCFLLDPVTGHEDTFLILWGAFAFFCPFCPIKMVIHRVMNIPKPQNNSDLPMLAIPCKISIPAISLSGCTKSDSSVTLSSKTTSVKISSKHYSTEPSRLDVVQCVRRRKGFLRRTAKRVTRRGGTLSSDVYHGKWVIFCTLCCCRNTSPPRVTMQQITDYLVYLHRERHQASFSHSYGVELSNARINQFIDGFFLSVSHLWNSLPSAVFLASFNFPSFKWQVCHHLRDLMV